MSTQGLNQSGNTQSTPPTQQQDYNQQSRKVSERQAGDFAERMAKEKREKEKKAGGEKDQSLESLMAERSKSSKDAIKGRQEKDQGGEHMSHNMRDGSEHAQINNTQSQIKADAQLREIQQASSVKEIDAALTKLADQIQVSAKDAINGAEVRISLKDSVLPGTEIRIQRLGGELTVTMNTSSAEAGNFLAQHEANLQKMLAERFSNDKVQVNINMSGGDNQDTDGRSRNQYVAEDNDQNSSRNDRA
ncbi:type III secretion HpaP family protein [Endozoicomonas elysicola]|uniref:Flagellar hook-length control protein-like C-terminal domain-containing protein n=1 Tax=Endozoicomonas elysicola TaxID=305900 RepID=A0A081KA73_9GAMM|nr:type III secretion HpaP family protein [Endozoicomonas elysicola]KEI71049.1 hypothetical protein GV64_10085 [Endozoicomonas elysicola]